MKIKSCLPMLLLAILSCQNPTPIAENTSVAIQRYDGFPKATSDSIAQTLSKIYSVQTTQSPAKMYLDAFTPQVKSPRFRADSIIKFQERNRKADYIFGLTQYDISVTKKAASGKVKSPAYKYQDWGIMGLAYCPGKSCVVSDFRLKTNDKKLQLTRLKKISVHEFGHNLGLPHCPNKNCVMTDAVESIATVDHARLALCAACQKKID